MLVLAAWMAAQGAAENFVPQQINPPFGFYWGETEQAIQQVVSRAQARVVDRTVINGRDTWTIEGLTQPALRRAVLYFGRAKTLVEVELQYEHPEWDLVAYEEFLNSARKRLEAKYGPPIVLARDKRPEGDIMETVVGYRWQQALSSIQLIFYSAQRNNDVYRTVSLHYRAG